MIMAQRPREFGVIVASLEVPDNPVGPGQLGISALFILYL